MPTSVSPQFAAYIPWLLLSGLVFAAVVFTLAMWGYERRRKQSIVAAFLTRGWNDSHLGDAIAIASRLPMLRSGKVKWAYGAPDRPVIVFEHQHSTGSGKQRRVHDHTIVCVPCPDAWPIVTLEEDNWLIRFASVIGIGRDHKINDEVFDAHWRIRTEDDATVLALLTPPMRELLLSGPKYEWWTLGKGYFACGLRHKCDAEDLIKHVDRFDRFLDLLPDEVRSMLPLR